MDIYRDSDKALHRAVGRFIRQASYEPIYIYTARIERRPFFAVISESEAKKHRLPVNKAFCAVGDSDSILEIKRQLRGAAPDKKTQLELRAIRGLHQYYQAQSSLAKLEWGGENLPKALNAWQQGANRQKTTPF